MKKAFSVLGLLIVIAILCIVSILMFRGQNPAKSVVDKHKEIQTKQEVINKQLEDIQRAKNLHDERMREDLEQNY